MIDAEKLAAFALVSGMTSLVPGPSMLFVMGQAMWRGGRSGATALAGVQLGYIGWWILAALWLRRVDLARQTNRAVTLMKLGIGLLLAVPAWAAAGLLHGDGEFGPRWLLYALVLVWAADTFAYFVGSRIGGRKLAPRISPNKTLEGVAGGVGLAMVVGVIGALLIGARLGQLPAVALVAAFTVLFSVAGDLFESLLKRHVGAKDSGTLIPGHGGVLDRIDSVLAALPVFALGKIWLGF